MNVALRRVIVAILTAALRKFGEAAASGAITGAHFGALGKLLPLLPVADLVALARGEGTVDSAIGVAEAGTLIVARAFPPAALTAAEVRLALEALQWLLDAAGVGGVRVKIEGGVPPSYPAGGGPGQYRGR